MKKLIFTILLAAVLWTVMFSPWTAPFVNFSWSDHRFCAHTVRVCHLVQSRLVAGGEVELAECLAGTWHCCCFVGRFLVGRQGVILDVRFCPSAGGLHLWDQEGESPWLLAALLLLLIGPAEEIFWRGYVQRTLSKRWNPNAGFVVATLIYALVHAGSCNFMLVMAALVVGAAWGALYRFFPNRFAAIILSHAVWDVAVFIFFPI